MSISIRKTSARIVLGCIVSLGLCGSLAATELELGGADGFYKPTSVEGSVRFAGRDFKLPLQALRKALLENGLVAVVDNRIPVDRVAWADLVEDFQFRSIKGDATARGPSSIVLIEDGKRFIGRTKKPLIVEQKGRFGFVPVTLLMRTNLPTVVKGDQLTMDSPVEIRALGLTSRGSIRMKATKIDAPTFPPDLDLLTKPK